jgi:hypothetical protein
MTAFYTSPLKRGRGKIFRKRGGAPLQHPIFYEGFINLKCSFLLKTDAIINYVCCPVFFTLLVHGLFI